MIQTPPVFLGGVQGGVSAILQSVLLFFRYFSSLENYFAPGGSNVGFTPHWRGHGHGHVSGALGDTTIESTLHKSKPAI
jgi:hypothetical protein